MKHTSWIVGQAYITGTFSRLSLNSMCVNVGISGFSVNARLWQAAWVFEIWVTRRRAANAQTNLYKCTGSPEPSLLAYTKDRYRWILGPKFRSLTTLDASQHARLKYGFVHAIRTNISCASPYLYRYSTTCVKRSLKNRQNKDLNDKW